MATDSAKPQRLGALTTQHTFSLEQIEEAMSDLGGFCVACGEGADNCEPDARRYKCESCGALEVYGAEELLVMGLVR